jgi:hypothetical protein
MLGFTPRKNGIPLEHVEDRELRVIQAPPIQRLQQLRILYEVEEPTMTVWLWNVDAF